MFAEPLDAVTLAQYRRFYAEEIRAVADLRSPLLVDALADISRERFVGPPPWSFSSQAPTKDGRYRKTEDARDLYHDVLVALHADRSLNNGQPSLIAGCIDQLDLGPGKRVLHVGCGTGYYTAIMARMVGPEGRVTAVDVDSGLAALAKANLEPFSNVAVFHRDGAENAGFSHVPEGGRGSESPLDAILINAGVTQPHPAWIGALAENGTLMVPFAIGESAASWKVLYVRIRRLGRQFSAEPYSIFALYPSATMRDAGLQLRLAESVQSRAIGRLRTLRVDVHEEAESCIVHTTEFCLSAREIEDVSSQAAIL